MDVQQLASEESVWSSEGSVTTPATMASVSSTLTNDVNVNNVTVTPGPDQVHIIVELPHPHEQFSNSMESQLQESTMAPTVFRKHLKFVKTEDKALKRLYEDIDWKMKNASSDDRNTVDNGSKSNMLHMDSQEDVRSHKPVTCLEDIDLAQRISLEEVISTPSTVHDGKVLLCLNAALPVLSHTDDGDGKGNFVIATVIQESESSPKAVRLEIVSSVATTEDFFHKLRYPYLNNFEPGSLLAIRNPAFLKTLFAESQDPEQGTTFSVRVSNMDADFLPLPPGAQKLWEREDTPQSEIDGVLQKSKASLWVTSTVDAKLATDEWKQWGSEYSVGRLHSQALFAYNIALRFDPYNVELSSARSTALINLGYYSGAMQDVELITADDPYNSGYILRKVNCLWGLEKYREAVEYLRSLVENLSLKMKFNTGGLSEETELKKKTLFIETIIVKTEKLMEQRMSPNQTGSERYFKGSSAKMYNDEPEYYKPIDVLEDTSKDSSKSGRRSIVVTNQKVSAGKLLAITKAFSVTVIDEPGKLFLRNHNDELTNQVLQKFALDKPTQSAFFKTDINDKGFEASGSGSNADRPMELTKKQIKYLCKKHFYSGNTSTEGISPLDGDVNFQFSNTVGGIWTFPMNIRHSCVGSNAVWYVVGNLLFIRAIRDLAQGEEVVLPHVDPTKSYDVRTQLLEEKELTCFCPLCQFEKSEPEQVKAKRARILNEMRMLNSLHSGDWSKEFTNQETKKLRLCLEDLIILRSAYTKLNFPAVEPLYNYGSYLMTMGNFDDAIVHFEKAFFVVDNTAAVFTLINISLHLAYCYMAKNRNREKNKAKKWFAAVKTYAKLSYGCLEPVKANFKHEFEYLERKGVAGLKME